MLKLYDYLPSQNAYKVRLLLAHLGIEYETIPVSLFEGEGQTDDFLSRNPAGAVPVLELEDGRTLPESNAILLYLAEGTQYLPTDPWLATRDFLVDCGYTIADMSMYAYVGFADEAGLPMREFANVQNWIARVRAQAGFLATVYPYSIDPNSVNELP